MGRACSVDNDEPVEGHAGGSQGRCVKLVGGCDANGPALGRYLGEQGQQQAELADADMGHEEFGERPDRPAATRQGRIELRVAGGKAGRCRACQAVATPDQVIEADGGARGEGSKGGHGDRGGRAWNGLPGK